MKQKELFITGGILFVLLLLSKMGQAAYYSITDWLIPQFEGFRSTPYWDVSRWTWGYGTAAPGPDGTITREKALADMRAYIDSDYSYLKRLITRSLSANQWAALLSFSYNEGRYSADNLIKNINSGNEAALETQWKQYIYAGGDINDTLVARRETEYNIWRGEV